jgi:crotonobetainyl-CoA:carnitine CoA-transferase CaiB-like acyl-CoA transferase
MNPVLQGIRVLDFGRYVAGPYCATLLAYLGADVIRIEKRDGGEDRFIAPFPNVEAGALLMQTACNKRSLALDFSHPLAQEVIDQLLGTADVVVVNLPQNQLKRLGLDWGRLQQRWPRLVLATQTAFGERGPLAGGGGFDGVAQAMSGAMYLSGTPGHPVKAAAPYVDFSTAVLSAFGVMAALLERERSGVGQHVQASLMATALAVLGSHLAEQGTLQLDRQPTGNRVQTSGPSDVFATRDGHILTHVVGNGLFSRCATLLGREDWLRDPTLQSDQARGDARDRLCAVMAEWCSERTSADALRELNQAGVPAGPVLDLRQALDHPQVAAMGWMQQVGYPGMSEASPVSGLPLELSAHARMELKAPATLGQHNQEILAELGFTQPQIDSLQKGNQHS